MLVELGLVEQRLRAVLEVLNDGASVSDVARRYPAPRSGPTGPSPSSPSSPRPCRHHASCARYAATHVALWLAELILRGNAVDQAPGDVRLGGFLLDMAKVYEDFLTVALSEAFRPHGGWSRAQDRHHLDVDDLIAMKPDLV